MKLDVAYVQYDTHKYPDSFSVLGRVLRRCSEWDCSVIRVDNGNERSPCTNSEGALETGGDNSFHEFSGWDKGRACLEEKRGPSELFLFANDSFPAYGHDYEGLLSDGVLTFVHSIGAVAGLIDRPEWKGSPLVLRGREVRYWVRTSFFLLPQRIMEKLGSLVVTEPSEFLKSGAYSDAPFRVDAPMSEGYRDYLLNWLGKDWHSAFELSEATWGRFLDKARMILNEHTLTQKWIEAGVPVYDLRFLKAFTERTGSSLKDLQNRRYRAFRENPITQLDFLHDDTLPRRVRNRLRLWGL